MVKTLILRGVLWASSLISGVLGVWMASALYQMVELVRYTMEMRRILITHGRYIPQNSGTKVDYYSFLLLIVWIAPAILFCVVGALEPKLVASRLGRVCAWLNVVQLLLLCLLMLGFSYLS